MGGEDANASTVNLESMDEDDGRGPEQIPSTLRESLNQEMKIKEGSENMLEALNSKNAEQTKEQRQKVRTEVNISNQTIKELRNQMTELQNARPPMTPTRSRIDVTFQNSNGLRSAERAAGIAEMESMGFERSQIDATMRAAFYNSEHAIEYLLTVSKLLFAKV
jgi:hypothetical protein